MSKNNNLGDFLKSLADKFRLKLDTTAKINPQDFESKIEEVGEVGYNEGWLSGAKEGIVQGKREAYDTFWDNYQSNGNRTAYEYAFAGEGWNNTTFKPKYDIVINKCRGIGTFYNSKITGSLQDILDTQGITFTINLTDSSSKSEANMQMFGYSSFSELPVCDFSTRTGGYTLYGMFRNTQNLEKIEKIILPTSCNAYGSYPFYMCEKLKEIRFEGTIMHSIDFVDGIRNNCPLSADTMQDIFGHLDINEYTGTRTITVRQVVKNNYIAKYGETEWDNNIALFSNYGWTFAINN